MRRQYELTIRGEPKQADVRYWRKGCVLAPVDFMLLTLDNAADRRLIDPPVIVQLRVIDPAARDRQNAPQDSANADSDDPPYPNLTYAQSFLQNPYYFIFASLAKSDDDIELHWLKDGRTRCTTASVVSSLYALKYPTTPRASTNNWDGSESPAAAKYRPTMASPASDAGFFVFPDLSVRREGSCRLELSLFEVVGCVGVSVYFILYSSFLGEERMSMRWSDIAMHAPLILPGSLAHPTASDVRHCKSIYSTPFYIYTAKGSPVWRTPDMLPRRPGLKIRIRKDIRMRGWAGRFLFLRRWAALKVSVSDFIWEGRGGEYERRRRFCGSGVSRVGVPMTREGEGRGGNDESVMFPLIGSLCGDAGSLSMPTWCSSWPFLLVVAKSRTRTACFAFALARGELIFFGDWGEWRTGREEDGIVIEMPEGNERRIGVEIDGGAPGACID
ncbi:velvet factor-domain-containing protein [Mycena galopus ATCC 62051]|nr:velvet factor-domain-containing protein [Mycena galopus ATCC 62051]